jgi:hypothetical protein
MSKYSGSIFLLLVWYGVVELGEAGVERLMAGLGEVGMTMVFY